MYEDTRDRLTEAFVAGAGLRLPTAEPQDYKLLYKRLLTELLRYTQ